MDDFKLKQIKRQFKLNQLVNSVIKENTESLKLERKVCQKEEEKCLLKKHPSSSTSANKNKKYENRFPFMLLGLIESVFIDEKDFTQIKEFGTGLLIDSNIVILPTRNLIYEVDRNHSSLERGDNKKENLKKINRYKLEEVNFIPFNISDKYMQFLPSKIKVKENFTPLNLQNDKETNSGEGNIINSWGLAVLDFPLGDFLKYIQKEEQEHNKQKNHKHNKSRECNSYSTASESDKLVEVKPVDNIDLFNSVIFFLESEPKNLSQNKMSHKDEYSFSENFYDIKFDDNLIFLRSLSTLDKISMDKMLPGVILSYVDRKYYLIGMNTNILIKMDDAAENNSGSSNIIHSKNPNRNLYKENEDELENELTHRIGVRFNRDILTSISEKIEEIKLTPELLPSSFSPKLFKIFERNLTTKEIFLNHLRENCKNLIEFIKEIKNDVRLKLSNEEKEMLTFKYQNQNEAVKNKKVCSINFIYFSLSLIWNKLSSTNSDNTLNLSSLNIGLYPGTEIIAEMLKNSENLICLNLNSNQIFSNGIKYLIKPIFNTKIISTIGKDLEHIHLDNNKLNSKSLKYLRHLLKATTSLKSLTLNHNYIAADGLKHLLNSMKSKNELTRFELSFNMLGKKSGKYLHEILKGIVNLKVLDLQSNSLTDSPIPFILSALKANEALQSLYLGNNCITGVNAINIATYLYENKNLLRLWLNNNPLSSEGVGVIAKSLGKAEADEREFPEEVENENHVLYNLPALREINLANVNAGFEGAQMFFNFIKKNKNISRIIFHSNNIGDIGCINIAEYLSTQISKDARIDYDREYGADVEDKEINEDEDLNESIYNSTCYPQTGLTYLSLSNNNISDDGAKILAEQFLKHKWLKEIKLNSNSITDEGAELLLYSILRNNSITKFNIENNNTTWRDKNIDVKNIRSNIQIFF